MQLLKYYANITTRKISLKAKPRGKAGGKYEYDEHKPHAPEAILGYSNYPS